MSAKTVPVEVCCHPWAWTVLTSNKRFEEWVSVLVYEVVAAALIDRLLHHCHIVNIRGNSYRMKEHQGLRRSASEDRQGVASLPRHALTPRGVSRRGSPRRRLSRRGLPLHPHQQVAEIRKGCSSSATG